MGGEQRRVAIPAKGAPRKRIRHGDRVTESEKRATCAITPAGWERFGRGSVDRFPQQGIILFDDEFSTRPTPSSSAAPSSCATKHFRHDPLGVASRQPRVPLWLPRPVCVRQPADLFQKLGETHLRGARRAARAPGDRRDRRFPGVGGYRDRRSRKESFPPADPLEFSRQRPIRRHVRQSVACRRKTGYVPLQDQFGPAGLRGGFRTPGPQLLDVSRRFTRRVAAQMLPSALDLHECRERASHLYVVAALRNHRRRWTALRPDLHGQPDRHRVLIPEAATRMRPGSARRSGLVGRRLRVRAPSLAGLSTSASHRASPTHPLVPIRRGQL